MWIFEIHHTYNKEELSSFFQARLTKKVPRFVLEHTSIDHHRTAILQSFPGLCNANWRQVSASRFPTSVCCSLFSFPWILILFFFKSNYHKSCSLPSSILLHRIFFCHLDRSKNSARSSIPPYTVLEQTCHQEGIQEPRHFVFLPFLGASVHTLKIYNHTLLKIQIILIHWTMFWRRNGQHMKNTRPILQHKSQPFSFYCWLFHCKGRIAAGAPGTCFHRICFAGLSEDRLNLLPFGVPPHFCPFGDLLYFLP